MILVANERKSSRLLIKPCVKVCGNRLIPNSNKQMKGDYPGFRGEVAFNSKWQRNQLVIIDLCFPKLKISQSIESERRKKKISTRFLILANNPWQKNMIKSTS